MKLKCPNLSHDLSGPVAFIPHPIVRKGYYSRKSDSRRLQRFLCKTCGIRFSRSTFSNRYYQKVRRINEPLRRLFVSGVSQNRAARILRVSQNTIARRFLFLAEEAKRSQKNFIAAIPKRTISSLQFDDLETSIHTKCKPVSVCLAVESKTRKILGFQVNQMPAKGRLALVARKKYGPRRDERSRGWNLLLNGMGLLATEEVHITSDENPHYPKWVKRHLPNARHTRIPGGRGAITGQGELRDKRFDPMFALNHTCAMLRANVNRLFRKTWCTSKKVERLWDHIALYVDYHNRELTVSGPIFGGSCIRTRQFEEHPIQSHRTNSGSVRASH
jgi:transposase-like protein